MWKPIPPSELKADEVILVGTMRARVLTWRWNIGRAECVVSAQYLPDSPEPYAGERTECVYLVGETAQVWRSDRFEDAVAEVE
jgi:hypothetical protein